MTILGINGGFRPGYQDVSACIVKDGAIVAAAEEERFSRIKYSAGRLPYLSILSVLKTARLHIENIDAVAFHGSTWEPEIENRIKDYFISHFGFAPPLERYHHHDCHAAGAYFSSGFEEALIITIDNSGDGVSLQVSKGYKNKITVLKRFERPNSLGYFYSIITQYCGFTKDSDEYKLMGLAAYGDKTKFDFSWLLSFEENELSLHTDYIKILPPKSPGFHRDEMNFNHNFISRMGMPARIPSQPVNSFYKDVAASAQHHLEQTVLKLVSLYATQTGLNKICLSGGVALNCLMNQRIMNASFCNAIFIQPAASDAGISVGAAWLAALKYNDKPVTPQNTYLGHKYTDEEILQTLANCQISYEISSNPFQQAADDIAAGKVLGWFRGRMEFGPRALGNRSILANACIAGMQERVNKKIKFRESFRPFGASVLEEDMDKYFQGKMKRAAYMTLVYDVKEAAKSLIPAVVHTDGTCRIQTVGAGDNADYYALLKNVKERTGHGVILNTSFNLNHEPIVESPRQAIASFFSSGLDVLYMNNYRIAK
jgi:carbamoyltransferase